MPSTPSMPSAPDLAGGLPTPTTAANDLSQGFAKGLASGAANPLPPAVPQAPAPPPAATNVTPASASGSAPPPAAASTPVAGHAAAPVPAASAGTPGADDRRRRLRPAISPHTAPTYLEGLAATPTVSASGAGGAASLAPPAATAGISSTGVPPSVLAASGIAATGTGAALVSSETQDQHLDDAIKLAYELLHASRMYPGLHWCVGIFKVATGIETVIVSNDGASYIPPGVYVPRSARVLFADPELGAGFQAKYFGWVNPTATMVAYAAERAVLDPNIELYAVAATTDPGGSSVLPARRAGVPHYQDCDSTRSPIDPATPAPNSTRAGCTASP